MSFAEGLHLSQGFFTLLGEATASFAGLLFVALAINKAEFSEPEKRHLLLLARQTFYNLMILTALSLIALAPGLGSDAKSFGGALGVACLGGFATSFVALREVHRAQTVRSLTREHFRAYYLPTVIYALLLFPAAQMITNGSNQLFYLGTGAIGLLLTSARIAWLLLFLPQTSIPQP